MSHTPFFPAWRSRLAAFGRRVQGVRPQSLLHLERLFDRLVPSWLLAQADAGANSRHRVYSLRRTFWGFLHQVLNPSCPCREIVRQIQALLCLHDLGSVKEGTGAYCQARGRLPLDTLQRIRHAVAARADQLLPQAEQLWHGLRPKVIDGTTLTLPDTPKNQRAYPQLRSQKPGCGFPLLKIVGIFSLSSGVLLDYEKGNKHRHEVTLLHKLLDCFKPRDLVIADRGFCNFVLLALLLLRGVGSLFRLHQARHIDWRKGKRLGKDDRLFTWSKPLLKPHYLPHYLWKRIPSELDVRVLRFQLKVPGFRPKSVTLATTMIDAERYPAEEVARLYARRWKIELWFRDIKTSMGMEVLRCQTPKMVHKELEMFLIAYNLIRALMAETSAIYEVALDRISFKGTVDAARQYSIAIAQAHSQKKQRQLVDELLAVLARDQVPARPGRREPRAIKRRPKPFPLLNRHRRLFKEISHRNRYWKNNPRKTRS
jgi:hypothetical protein